MLPLPVDRKLYVEWHGLYYVICVIILMYYMCDCFNYVIYIQFFYASLYYTKRTIPDYILYSLHYLLLYSFYIHHVVSNSLYSSVI